jgi:hypothetical protein
MTLIFPGHVLFIETELLPAMACCNAAPGHTGNCQIVSRKEGISSRMDGAEICTYQAPAVWYFMIHAVLRQVSKVRPDTADLVIRRAALYAACRYQGRGYRTGMTLV